MAYHEFTPERALRDLGLTARGEPLFPDLRPVEPPPWLPDTLRRNRRHPLVSEKSRGEILVFPILVAAQELSPAPFTVFSGQTLTGDSDLGLNGVCDFILARTPAPVPALTAPVLTVVEAKGGDIEAGVGQGIAQMVGARLFNERDGIRRPVYGAVTNGESWQFLRLDGSAVGYDLGRPSLNDLGTLLATLIAATAP